VSQIFYGESSSGTMHNDALHYSWALGGNPQFDVGSSHSVVNAGFAFGHVDDPFGGSNGEFQDDQ